MRLRYGFNDAIDVYVKTYRDGALLHDEVTKDRFWSFLMTANAISDWVQAGPFSDAVKKEAKDVVWHKGPIEACRDLCNAGKHCEITRYSPKTRYAAAEGGFGYGFGHGQYGLGFAAVTRHIPKTGDGFGEDEYCVGVVDVDIKFVYDGREYRALELVYGLVWIWGEFFERHGLVRLPPAHGNLEPMAVD